MKQYKVTEYRTALAMTEYVVSADSEDEAISIVQSGEVDPSDFGFTIEDYNEFPPHYEAYSLTVN
jgi:hypothetical protein